MKTLCHHRCCKKEALPLLTVCFEHVSKGVIPILIDKIIDLEKQIQNLQPDETAKFWDSAFKASEEVKKWPKWKTEPYMGKRKAVRKLGKG